MSENVSLTQALPAEFGQVLTGSWLPVDLVLRCELWHDDSTAVHVSAGKCLPCFWG